MAAMNISLRRYVFMSLFVLASVVIAAFSWMSANQFLAGMDGMMASPVLSR